MKIPGFSAYEVEPNGEIYSYKTGKRKRIGGSKKDRIYHLHSDEGVIANLLPAKVLWCAEHGVNPLNFPKDQFIVSKKYGVTSRAEMVKKAGEFFHSRKWTKEQSIEELEQSVKDIEYQLEYFRTGDMTKLLSRFESLRPEVEKMLRLRYSQNPNTAKLILEDMFDAFLKCIQNNVPLRSIYAYMISSAKKYVLNCRRQYRKRRKLQEYALHNEDDEMPYSYD